MTIRTPTDRSRTRVAASTPTDGDGATDDQADASTGNAFDDDFLDGPRPRDVLARAQWQLGRTMRQRSRDERATAATVEVEPERAGQGDLLAGLTDTVTQPAAERQPAADPIGPLTGRPVEARLRAAARDLAALGTSAGFAEAALAPSNEFPTLMTRLPIFRPSQRRTQQGIQDEDNAVAFETPFGTGRRLGPPLTVRDEDTLIALMRLRDRRLRGPESALPANVRDLFRPVDGQAEIHRVVCTVQQIHDELGLTDSGTNFKKTMASIKRLGAASIELERVDLKDGTTRGGTFRLVSIQWATHERHGLIDVVFPPLMAHWLMRSYTYIDWRTRLQLPGLGKAIHRFLSGQPPTYTIGLKKLAGTVGYDGRSEQLKRNFSGALDALVATGWLKEWTVRGTGRGRSPWMLTTVRASREDLRLDAPD